MLLGRWRIFHKLSSVEIMQYLKSGFDVLYLWPEFII